MESFEYIKKKADRGDTLAQAYLGSAFYLGKEVKQNYYEAVKWYRLAADQGNAIAQYSLGVMYQEGEGVSQNYFDSVKYIKLAADQELNEAQFQLALLYFHGKGVTQDYSEAFKYFKSSADHGDARSQSYLGHMYLQGEGVIQDYSEAFKYLKSSADRGDARSQGYLAYMFYNGKGVTQDYDEAFEYIKLAADGGVASAQEFLINLKCHRDKCTRLAKYPKITFDEGEASEGSLFKEITFNEDGTSMDSSYPNFCHEHYREDLDDVMCHAEYCFKIQFKNELCKEDFTVFENTRKGIFNDGMTMYKCDGPLDCKTYSDYPQCEMCEACEWDRLKFKFINLHNKLNKFDKNKYSPKFEILDGPVDINKERDKNGLSVISLFIGLGTDQVYARSDSSLIHRLSVSPTIDFNKGETFHETLSEMKKEYIFYFTKYLFD